MEKRKPHYPLAQIKLLIRNGEFRVTFAAQSSAFLDFQISDASDLAKCILEIEETAFYKSMSSFHDATVWQDVYRPMVFGIAAYVKLQIVNEKSVVISFKRK